MSAGSPRFGRFPGRNFNLSFLGDKETELKLDIEILKSSALSQHFSLGSKPTKSAFSSNLTTVRPENKTTRRVHLLLLESLTKPEELGHVWKDE